jgi:malonyl-CoA O-methyltransferase
MSIEFSVEKQLLRQSFGSASSRYDDFAQLQRTVGFELLQRCQINQPQGKVLDLGCGTGFLTKILKEQGASMCLTGLDIAFPMLEQAKSKLGTGAGYICADAENLPFQACSFDAIFSNLALQWCLNIRQVLSECKRILKPGGQLAFSTFGPQTLQELKQSWAQLDEHRHVNDFYPVSQLQFFLECEGWKNCRIEQQVHPLEYSTVLDLMHELKGLGAHNIAGGRNKHLTGKSKLRKVIENYPKSTDSGRIVASYELIWVFAEVG